MTENIIVLEVDSGGAKKYVVKEGNRRIGALKLIHGIIRSGDMEMPDNIATEIKQKPKTWKNDNKSVPCAIYPSSDSKTVDRVVALTHGKGDKAGRDPWGAVARARHNRDMLEGNEPAIDLLEEYLKVGRNLSEHQKELWAGAYPLTVLEEAMKKWAPRLGATTSRDLADQYPKSVLHRKGLEQALYDIGCETLGFQELRDPKEDVADSRYAIPAPPPTSSKGANSTSKPNAGAKTASGSNASGKTQAANNAKTKAVSITDPESVLRKLKSFKPVGKHRDKIVTLLDEMKRLNIRKTPHAFCFVLRSTFELSAKAYCADHSKLGGPSPTKKGGEDKRLADLLREITKHLTQDNADKAMVKQLHGAMTELGKHEGILSVTSFNQLVHNTSFSTNASDICSMFGNVFPLLEAMNS